MILDPSTKAEIVLGGAVSANQPEVHVEYRDWNPQGEPTKPALFRTVANSTTDVTILAAPSQGFIREVQRVAIYNKDTASVTVTVKTDDATNERIVCKQTLLTLETLHFEQGRGWYAVTASGSLKSAAIAKAPTRQVLSGSGTYTTPAGVIAIEVECWGPGGSGAAGDSGSSTRGAGGGAGAYCRKLIANPAATYSYSVGTGGAGVAAAGGGAAGNAGSGATTFGSLSAGAGAGGGNGSAAGGAGGTASNGDENISGQAGEVGQNGGSTTHVANGGNAPRGGMGGASNVGESGSAPGGGGACGNHTGGSNSGAGANGSIVVTEFYG